MADMLAVLWHVNTYTSAMIPRDQVAKEYLNKLMTDAAERLDFDQWCNANALSPQDGFDISVDQFWAARNKRSKFTELSAYQRIQELQSAVAAARSWASKRGTPDVVFVAPEYLFAQSGFRHLLQGQHQLQTIRQQLTEVSQKAAHTLLFPGTVAYRESMTGKSVKARAKLYEDIHFWNKQGVDGDPLGNKAKIHQIAMRGSKFDSAHNKAYAFLNGKTLMEYTKRGDFHEVTAQDDTGNQVFVPGKGAGTLQAFGKSFGVEICLDHNMGYSVKGGPPTDVHVIMSAAVKPVSGHENTVGRQPGKVGFVVHASCALDFTQVIRWAGGVRSEVKPVWEHLQGHGKLLGYQLDFSTTKSGMGVTAPTGHVKAMKAKFGG